VKYLRQPTYPIDPHIFAQYILPMLCADELVAYNRVNRATAELFADEKLWHTAILNKYADKEMDKPASVTWKRYYLGLEASLVHRFGQCDDCGALDGLDQVSACASGCCKKQVCARSCLVMCPNGHNNRVSFPSTSGVKCRKCKAHWKPHCVWDGISVEEYENRYC
jgi:hypothetical protein